MCNRVKRCAVGFKDAARMANSIDSDQTEESVRTGSALSVPLHTMFYDDTIFIWL